MKPQTHPQSLSILLLVLNLIFPPAIFLATAKDFAFLNKIKIWNPINELKLASPSVAFSWVHVLLFYPGQLCEPRAQVISPTCHSQSRESKEAAQEPPSRRTWVHLQLYIT